MSFWQQAEETAMWCGIHQLSYITGGCGRKYATAFSCSIPAVTL